MSNTPAASASNPAAFMPMPLLLLLSLFSGMLTISTVLAAKLVQVGPVIAPAGVLAFALTFACTDIVSEVYGRRIALRMILSGMVVLVAVGILSLAAVVWPSPPVWQQQAAFSAIIGQSLRIALASLVAYFISQNLDVFIFHHLKKTFKSRHLWLRNNLSTSIAQLVDTSIFILLAFYGKGFPLFQLIFGQWLLKIAIAALDTPLVYLSVWWLKKSFKAVD